MALTRRDVLKLGGLVAVGAAGVVAPLGATALQAKSASLLPREKFPPRYTRPLLIPPVLQPTKQDGSPYFGADYKPGQGGTRYYDITARAGTAELIPGFRTPVGAYDGLVPGPILSVEKGEPAVVVMRNHLPAANPMGGDYRISTHLHGSESLPEYDGYAADVTKVGFKKTYRYPNTQPARTLWYHDHGQHYTAQNAYGGLAAQYHLHDERERELLPQGKYDVPLTVTDAIFNADGTLAYRDNSHSGLWGDVVLVNGRAWPTMRVERRTYRFRILVASISRSFRFTLSGDPLVKMVVVGTDGGVVPKGTLVDSFRHGPSERYEVVIDFSKASSGTTRVELLNLSNPNNIDYDFTGKVMAFDIDPAPYDPAVEPKDPTWNREYAGMDLVRSPIMDRQVTGKETVVQVRVKKDVIGQWTFGDQTWSDIVASDYTKLVANPALGETQIWEITNSSGGWFHPVHIHLIDFKILSRNGRPPLPHECGPKDVVYVGEAETVRLLITFESPSDRQGRYMVHCHNLPHEDHDMMTQFSVGPVRKDDPHHPVLADPAVEDLTYPR